MFTLPNSNQYTLNFAFCQTDLPDIQGFDDAVKAKHGICSVLAMDWLQARLNNTSFIVSMQSVWAKEKQFKKLEYSFARVYANYCPDLRLGATRSWKISPESCLAAINLIPNHGGIAIHLGVSLDRRDAGDGAHVVAVVRNGNQYKMFDCNFGEFTADSARNCAAWLNTLCNHVREARGKYIDWAVNLHPIVFTA